MADLETRGSVASRNTTRVTPATTASRTQRDIPLVVAGERPVVYNIARPRSRLHEIARGLGNLSQSLESREEQQSKVDEVAGRRAARTGEAQIGRAHV